MFSCLLSHLGPDAAQLFNTIKTYTFTYTLHPLHTLCAEHWVLAVVIVYSLRWQTVFNGHSLYLYIQVKSGSKHRRHLSFVYIELTFCSHAFQDMGQVVDRLDGKSKTSLSDTNTRHSPAVSCRCDRAETSRLDTCRSRRDHGRVVSLAEWSFPEDRRLNQCTPYSPSHLLTSSVSTRNLS